LKPAARRSRTLSLQSATSHSPPNSTDRLICACAISARFLRR
jgi:hypothetical protein